MKISPKKSRVENEINDSVMPCSSSGPYDTNGSSYSSTDEDSIQSTAVEKHADKATMAIMPTHRKCTSCTEKAKKIKYLQRKVIRLKIKFVKYQNSFSEEVEVNVAPITVVL